MDGYLLGSRRLTLWFACLSTAIVLGLLPFTKVRVDFSGIQVPGYFCLILFVGSAYSWKREIFRLAPALEVLAIGFFVTGPILLSTYLAASLDMPLVDAALIRADAALGFDWHEFIRFVDASPFLAETLALAYTSFAHQLLLLPVILSISGRYTRSYEFILAYAVICYVSSVISIWTPALGTYPSYGVSQDQLSNIDALYGFYFLTDFLAIRSSETFLWSMENASGIITFPSVHAAGALLCAWAAWDVKPLRYPLAAWNVLMATSAVSHANHYLVDVPAGFAIAAASIFAVRRSLRLAGHLTVKAPVAVPVQG
jgi:membrane-associated phospholipid phosphatase